MDPMEVLIRRSADEASRKALTDGLRRRRDVSYLAQLSGDPTTQQFGSNLYGATEGQRKDYVASQEKADQRSMTQGYYDQMAKQSALANTMAERRQTETERHNRRTEEMAGLRSTMAGRKIPNAGIQKDTEDLISTAVNMQYLTNAFKDEYASNVGFGEGTVSNFLGKTPIGSDAQKEQAQWWSEYQRIYELPTRNKMFGSALTATEQAAWKQANISPNSPPEVIREAITRMQRVMNDALERKYSNHSTLYDQDWVYSAYSPLFNTEAPSEQGSAPSAPQEGVIDWSDMK